VIRKIINIFNIVFIVAETLIYKYKYSNCRMAVGVGRVKGGEPKSLAKV
jgi:hypothetical protein